MAKFFHQPNGGEPQPVYIRYIKPDRGIIWLHYLPTGLRWGFDEWGNRGWLIDGTLLRDGKPVEGWGPILLSGVTHVQFAVPD